MKSNDEILDILHKLQPSEYNSRHFELRINYFLLKIMFSNEDGIEKLNKSNVYLYECDRDDNYYASAYRYIDMRKDHRFVNYKPIKYDEYGRDDVNNMPIIN